MEFKRIELIWRRICAPQATLWERFLTSPLLPVSWLYRGLGALRRSGFRHGVFKSQELPVPVISVGNLVLGGSGKTPIAMAIAEHLSARGLLPMILLRGYGKVVDTSQLVSDGMGGVLARSSHCGEEAVMTAQKVSGAVVVVGSRRWEAGRLGISVGADCAVLDDGFQHLSLKRDLDLVVVDSALPLPKVFPRGNAREGWRALHMADCILLNSPPGGSDWEERAEELSKKFPRIPVIPWRKQELYLRNCGGGERIALSAVEDARILLFSMVPGIADIAENLRSLKAKSVRTVPFPDHHRYLPEEIAFLSGQAPSYDLLLTTEKDEVSLVERGYDVSKIKVLVTRPQFLADGKKLWAMIDRVCAKGGEI